MDDTVAAESAAIRSRIGGTRGAVVVESAAVRASVSAEADATRARIGDLRTSVDDAGRTTSAAFRKAAESTGKMVTDIADANRLASASASQAAKSASELSGKAVNIADDISDSASKVATDMDRTGVAASRSVSSLSGKATAAADSVAKTAGKVSDDISGSASRLNESLSNRMTATTARLRESRQSSLVRFTRLDDAVVAESATVRSHIGRIRGAAAIESATVRAAISAESAATRTRIGDLRVIVDDAGRTTGIAIRKAADSADKMAAVVADDVSKAASKVAVDMDRSAMAASRSVSSLSSKAATVSDSVSETAGKVAADMDRTSITARRSIASLSGKAVSMADGISGAASMAAMDMDRAGAMADRSVGSLSGRAAGIADDISKSAGKIAADTDRAHTAVSRSVTSLSRSVTAIDALQSRIDMVEKSADTARVTVRSGLNRISESVGRLDVSKGDAIASQLDGMGTSLQQSLTRSEARISTISTRLQEGIGRIDQAMSQMAKKIDDSRLGAALRQSQPAAPLRRGGVGDRPPSAGSSGSAPTRRQAGARGGRWAVAAPGSTAVNKAASVGVKALSPALKTAASIAKIGAKVLLSTPVGIVADAFIPDRELGIGTLDADYWRAVDTAIKEMPALLSTGRSSRLNLTAQSPGEITAKLSKYVSSFYGEIPAHVQPKVDSGPTMPRWWQSRMQALVDHPRKVLSLARKGSSRYTRPFSQLLQAHEGIGQYTISKGMVDKYKQEILENPPRIPIEVIIFNWVRKNMSLRSEESVSVDPSLLSSNVTMGDAPAESSKSSGGLWGKIKGFFASDKPAPGARPLAPAEGFAYAPSGSAKTIAVMPDAEQSRIPDGMSPTDRATQSAMNAVRQEMQAEERKRADRTSSGRSTGFSQEGSAPPITGTGNQQGRTIPSNVSDMGMLIALTEGEDRDLRDLVE